MTQPKTQITVICCICHKDLGTKDGQGVSGISHGFCDTCRDKALAKIKGSTTSLKEVQP